MANSNENSLNAHLHNPDFNPTSEVGSGPYVAMEQQDVRYSLVVR